MNFVKVDTYNIKNRTRHIGIINRIQIPLKDKQTWREVSTELVATKCGKYLVNFHEAEINGSPVSYFYTDGSRYSTPCSTCLPDDLKVKSLEVE